MARRMEREMFFYLCQLADTDKVFVDIRIGFQTEEAILSSYFSKIRTAFP